MNCSPDSIFINGNIITLEPQCNPVEALASKGGRILALGTNEEILALKDAKTEVVDMEGLTVLPGFIDSHCHMELTSKVLSLMPRCHTPPLKSIEEIINVLKKDAASKPKGEWVIGQGCHMQDLKLTDNRFPNRHDLDKVSTDHPVVMRCGYHVTILNSKALEYANITRHSPDPPPPAVIMRDNLGEPTGLMTEFYHSLPLPTVGKDLLKKCIVKTSREFFLEKGVTSIHCLPYSAEGIQAYQELQSEGLLPLRIRLHYEVPRQISLDSLLSLGLKTGFGNEWLNYGGVKLFVDGGITSYQGAFFEDYTSMPGWSGILSFSQEELNDIVLQCHKNDTQILMHTAGDLAMEMAISAIENAQKLFYREDHRHRLEHIGNLLPQNNGLERIKAAGAIPVPNYPLLYSFGEFFELLLGSERTKKIFAARTLLDMGFPVPGNSDGTGSDPLTMNPFWGISCVVNRKSFNGYDLCMEEAITVLEGLKSYTLHSAYAGFEENHKGSLKVGKLSDMIAVSENPLEISKSEVGNIKVLLTIVGGKVVYRA